MNPLRVLDKWLEEVVCSVLLVALVTILGWQVVERFLFATSTTWHEEVVRFIFIWLVYLGISLGVKRREHIRIMAFVRFIPKRAHRVLYYFSEVGWLGFCVVVFILSISMMQTMFQFKHLSAALHWNMAYIYLIIPISMVLTSIRIIQGLVQDLRSGSADFGEGV